MTACIELAGNTRSCRVLVDVAETTAAAAAAAATATAAAVANVHCWGHTAAIEASVEGSTATPAGASDSILSTSCGIGWVREEASPLYRARPRAWLLREADAPSSLALCTPRASASSLPERKTWIRDRSQDTSPWGSRKIAHSLDDLHSTSQLRSKAILRLLSMTWKAWHLQAVARSQTLRRQLRHARGLRLCRRFRAWHEVVATGTTLATGGTVRFQQRRAARFVQGHMLRLHAARLLHQCRARWVRDTTRLLLGTWRLACALTLLTQRVAVREHDALLCWALCCFMTAARQTAALRRLVRQRHSLMGACAFKVFQTNVQVSREVVQRAAACDSKLLRSCLQSLHLRARSAAAERRLAARCSARMLRDALLALHAWVQVMTSMRCLRARRAVVIAHMCFVALHEWAETATTMRSLLARHNTFLLQAALKAFSIRMQIAAVWRAAWARQDVAICQMAFGILHRHTQISAAVKLFTSGRLDRVLHSVFEAYRAQVKEALALKSVARNARLCLARRHQRASLQKLRARAMEAQKRRHTAAAVKIWAARRRCRSAIAALHRESVVALGVLDISFARASKCKKSVYLALRKSVVVARKAQDISTKHVARSAHDVIKRWVLAARARQRISELPATSALAARCCLVWWACGCPLPAILLTWRLSAAFVQRECRAMQLCGRAFARSAQMVLSAWAALAASPQQLRWRLEWQRTLRSAVSVLQAWHQHLRMLAAAGASHHRCCWRLLQWSWRHWQAASLTCHAEKDFLAAAFRSWRLGAEHCQHIRDETLRSRWLDEVAAAFVTRRLLRSVMHGFTAWGSHALCIHALRARVFAGRSQQLRFLVLHVFWANSALARMSAVGRIVDGALVQHALQRWRLTNTASTVAALCQRGRVLRTWRDMQAIVSRRRAAMRFAKVLAEHLSAWSYRRLAAYMYEAAATESRAVSILAHHRGKAIFTAWFSSWRAQRQSNARKEALPIVLKAWRRVCKERYFRRRQALRAGMRAWRSHARGRWAVRRRFAVAELLAARRLLRAALLPWQLICFAETPSHAVLLQRWSDAVADPGVLRPLVALRGTNLPDVQGNAGVTAAAKACTVRDGPSSGQT
mmetsp:Transcript_149405/g.264089  ORF Transcript_149405/g.264089 Transcript_149405/m.264089 type:complete len:1097 (+) Transcript_149405:61-3351(+)